MATMYPFTYAYHSDAVASFLATIAVTPDDQVRALTFINDSFGTRAPSIFRQFVTHLRTIHPELVEATLSSRRPSYKAALIARHTSIEPDSLARILDSHQVPVMEAVVAADVIEFVPEHRLSRYATRTSSTAVALLSSRRATVEHLSEAINEFFALRTTAINAISPAVFAGLVERCGVEEITDTIIAASPSYWWIMLASHQQCPSDLMSRFFNRGFEWIRQHDASLQALRKEYAHHYDPKIRQMFQIFNTLVSTASGSYPTTLGPTSPVFKALTAVDTSPLGMSAWLASTASTKLHADLLAAVAPGHSATDRESSDPAIREFWLLNTSDKELLDAFLSRDLGDDDIERLLATKAGLRTLARLAMDIRAEHSNSQHATRLYLLVDATNPDTGILSYTSQIRKTLAQALPFEDQVRYLPISALIDVADSTQLRKWWDTFNPPPSLDVVLALSHNDLPLQAMIDVAGTD